jgi:hypothetical protein
MLEAKESLLARWREEAQMVGAGRVKGHVKQESALLSISRCGLIVSVEQRPCKYCCAPHNAEQFPSFS